jgi:hypothetical protein
MTGSRRAGAGHAAPSAPVGAAAHAGRRRVDPAPRSDRAPLWRAGWFAGLLASLVVLGELRLPGDVVDLPDRVGPGAASLLGVVLAIGLTVRTGGRPQLPALLAAGYGVVATATLWPVLLAGGAVGVGVLAAALAVTATVPATTYARSIVEVVLACAFATAGGLGVAGFDAHLRHSRFAYVVLGISLAAAFALVYRLGAGFHGLGRRGYLVAGGALLLLVLALAYSEALGRWGSPEVVGRLDDLRHSVRVRLHAVPHPIETLLGVPALCWGTFMRARRRQGWWVCAFGAAVTAPSTTRFVEGAVPTLTTILGAAYSLVLGLLLGYVVIRVEQAFTGSRGRRARRDEEASAHRPEPGRLDPLH